LRVGNWGQVVYAAVWRLVDMLALSSVVMLNVDALLLVSLRAKLSDLRASVFIATRLVHLATT
jgi:hypothetical protein